MHLQGTTERHQDILRRLETVRRRELRVAALFAAQLTVLAVFAILVVAVVTEELLHFGSTGRTVIVATAAIGIAAVLGRFLAPPLLRLAGILRRPSDEEIARNIGRHFPGLRERLMSALQLYAALTSGGTYYSPALIEASIGDLHAQIEPLDLAQAVDKGPLRKSRRAVWYAFAVTAIVLVISPSGFFTSFTRLTRYQETFAATPSVRLFVEPGNTTAVRGQTVPLSIRAEGALLPSLTLLTRMEGEASYERAELAGSGGVFHAELKALRSSTEYYASAGGVESERYRITVLDRPLVRSFRLTLTPPPYTRLPVITAEENAGDISVYPGTVVRIALSSSKPVTDARLVLSDSTEVSLHVEGTAANGNFRPRKNATYHIVLRDAAGLTNVDAVEYTIAMMNDAYPTVEILSPGKNLNLTERMAVPLLLRIKDDFGFSRLRIAWRLAQSKYVEPSEEVTTFEIPLTGGRLTEADVPYLWDLSSMHLVPEDAIAYYAEVFDNDNVSGPKSARSETFMLRLPSLEEVFSNADQSHQESMESMKGMAKEAEQLRKDLDDLQRELRKNPQHPDWQAQQKAEQLLQRYDALQKKMDDVTQRLDEAVKKMDENKLLSEKTADQYNELRKLMEQINSPELRDALRKLQESLKQQSSPQMQQAMQQMKLSEEQLQQMLERTLELLKRIHIDQKLDELIKRTEELQNRQGELRDEAKNTSQSDQQKRADLARRQSDMKEPADALRQKTEELRKDMEELAGEMPLKEMEDAGQQLSRSELSKQMDRSSQQMSSGNMEGAQRQQEQSMNDMETFAQQLRKAQKTMRENQTKEALDALRKQTRDLLELSKQEESLKEETKGLDPNSRRFRESMQDQDDIRSGLNNIADRMNELGKKSFAITPEMGRAMGDAMRSMDEAMRQMEARQPGGSSQQQTAAMGSLNEAAKLMQGAMNSMMQSGSNGGGMPGLMGQLGQMAGQQGQINQETKDAMGGGQGEGGQGMSAQQQAAYSRLAGRQAAVQKSIRELSEEAKNSGEFSKLLGDLDKVAQEMTEVQTDLEQHNVNPATLQKQDRILSRLLDSQRSMRERDYEKRRKAESGKTPPRDTPAELDLTTQEGKNRLREELLRVLESKYAKDYEALIRKYFEALDKASAERK